jgi:hypothetical protein
MTEFAIVRAARNPNRSGARRVQAVGQEARERAEVAPVHPVAPECTSTLRVQCEGLHPMHPQPLRLRCMGAERAGVRERMPQPYRIGSVNSRSYSFSERRHHTFRRQTTTMPRARLALSPIASPWARLAFCGPSRAKCGGSPGRSGYKGVARVSISSARRRVLLRKRYCAVASRGSRSQDSSYRFVYEAACQAPRAAIAAMALSTSVQIASGCTSRTLLRTLTVRCARSATATTRKPIAARAGSIETRATTHLTVHQAVNRRHKDVHGRSLCVSTYELGLIAADP